jgi:hypothetical protein
MVQSGNYRESQCDLQAYWQQLSYPQLLAPGRAHACYRPRKHRIGTFVGAVIGFSLRCGRRP